MYLCPNKESLKQAGGSASSGLTIRISRQNTEIRRFPNCNLENCVISQTSDKQRWFEISYKDTKNPAHFSNERGKRFVKNWLEWYTFKLLFGILLRYHLPQRCHDCHDCHLSLRISETWSFAHYNKNIYIFIIVDDFDNPFSLMTIMTNDNRDNVVALQSEKMHRKAGWFGAWLAWMHRRAVEGEKCWGAVKKSGGKIRRPQWGCCIFAPSFLQDEKRVSQLQLSTIQTTTIMPVILKKKQCRNARWLAALLFKYGVNFYLMMTSLPLVRVKSSMMTFKPGVFDTMMRTQ